MILKYLPGVDRGRGRASRRLAALITAIAILSSSILAGPVSAVVGGTITGKVTATGGAPLSGITVQAGTVVSNGWTAVGSSTTTAGDGTYSLSVAGGRYAIRFSDGTTYAAGFYSTGGYVASVPAATQILVTSTTIANINVILPPARTISGIVTGPGAIPLSGISVDALTSAGVFIAASTTNGSGAYTLYLPSGSYRLRISDATKTYPSGYYTGSGLVTNLASADGIVVTGSNITGKDIQLAAARHISGTVIDSLSAPVGGMTVTAGLGSATTAGDGTYTVTVPSGAHIVRFTSSTNAQPAGFYISGSPSLTASLSAATAVDVTGGDATGIDVQLPAGVMLSGTVTGTAGALLAGIEVWLLPVGSVDPLVISTTNPSGAYSIRTGPGSYVVKFNDPTGKYTAGFYRSGVTSNFTKDQATATQAAVASSDVALAAVGLPLFQTVVRQSGSDRYATAAAISRGSLPTGPDVVYVATGLNYPDALAAAAAAAHLGGSVLLVTSTGIPSSTATELTRLNPGRIVVAGGAGVVSNAVVTALDAYTTGTVTRQSGADRYATAADISAKSFSADVAVAYVATGENFPDALAAAGAAGRLGGPVLLVRSGSIPSSIQAELTRLNPGRIIVAGGAAVVSDTVMTQLAAFTSGTVTRQWGANRYATAATISAETFVPGAPVVYVATGANFPDALSAAAAAGRLGGPVLLTGSSLSTDTTGELSRLQPNRIVVAGGTGVVSNSIVTQLGAYVPS